MLIGVVVAAGCDRDVDSITSPAKLPAGPNALIVQTGYSDVSMGSSTYGCAVRAVDGGIVCWGDDDYHRAEPPTSGAYRQASAGSQHGCALRSDYFVVCWGNHDWGESSPPAITFSQVSAGQKYSCGVRMDNRLLACWGSTVRTALSNGTPSVGFKQISAGTVHACGVAFSDGRVLCWGDNGYGQSSPPSGAFSQVAVGSGYTCALRTAGTLACWGDKSDGATLAPLGAYTQVSAGQDHACAIRASDRNVVCWGRDNAGSLTMPAGAYTKLSVGLGSTCAIRADSTLVCAGNNAYGQATPPAKATAHAAPQATIGATTNVKALDSLTVMLSGARVPGFPAAKAFTYRYDCGDGKGYGAVTTATFAKCATRVAGQRTLRGKVIDQDGDTASYVVTVTVVLRPQTVAISSKAPVSPIVGSTYAVTATASSGLPVTVSGSAYYYCSVSGNVVTFTGIAIGVCTVTASQKGDSTWAAASATQTMKPIWPFSGFFLTVRNQPQWNTMVAGRYAKLIFSIGGNRATSGVIVPSGTASAAVVACDPNVVAPFNVTLTSPVATTGVVYDSGTARYTLTWKTDVAWKGSCRTVTVTLNDGTEHKLSFKFT
jgi:hypothetical protein